MSMNLNAIKNIPEVCAALEQIELESKLMLDYQLELCAIASPSGKEQNRAKRFAEMFFEAGLEDVYIDEVNNVFGKISGTEKTPPIMLTAHIDTVFKDDVDCTPKIKDGIIYAPGINDDTRGMVEILSIARAMLKQGIKPKTDIIFCGTAGEEGGFTGVKHIFSKPVSLSAFISIDGSVTNKLTINALGGYNYRITFTGSGGHASHLFGIPNANLALGRAIVNISNIIPPKKPRTIYNIGIVRGGVAINGIPREAYMEIDIRSSDNNELEDLKDQIVLAAHDACKEENLFWSHEKETVDVHIEQLSHRTAYKQDPHIPLIQAAITSYRFFGQEPFIPEGSSTDADIPMHNGVPAIAIGRGGVGKDSHTINEWFDPTDAHLAVQRDLFMLLSLSGIANISE